MHLHILGICGTFMGGLALLAREMGYQVTGSDVNAYPPMSTLLADNGVEIRDGYTAAHLSPAPDLVLVGNALSRGNAAIERMLERRLPFISGPEWLTKNLLRQQKVLAVAGTHGKTTTSAMLAHILEQCGLEPGFLIGGVPGNFTVSARRGGGTVFVLEADEYDTAFFDKRSKFVHYHPDITVLNNLEFDHADIFNSLEDIERQFHHLIRTVPANGLIISNGEDKRLENVISMGCWSPVERFGCDPKSTHDWSAIAQTRDHSRFQIQHKGENQGPVAWNLFGAHNMHNALAAVAAAHAAGVAGKEACAALTSFKLPGRRLELVVQRIDGVRIFDDFAHHPTAIEATLEALRHSTDSGRIIAIIEPRSNTMKRGHHLPALSRALGGADIAIILKSDDLSWDPALLAQRGQHTKLQVLQSVPEITASLLDQIRPNDTVVLMSNGNFGGLRAELHGRLGNATPARP